jgi:hypothetical protein
MPATYPTVRAAKVKSTGRPSIPPAAWGAGLSPDALNRHTAYSGTLDGTVWKSPPARQDPPEQRPISLCSRTTCCSPHLSAVENVATVRALVTDPKVLLLDESLAAFDVSTKTDVRRLLGNALRQSNTADVLVTHDLLDAVALGDRMVVIENGGIVQTGTPAEVTASPRSRCVADLIDVNLLHGTARGTVPGVTVRSRPPNPLRQPIVAMRAKMLSLSGVACDGGGLAGSFATYRANARREAIRQLAELRTRLDVAEDADGRGGVAQAGAHPVRCRRRPGGRGRDALPAAYTGKCIQWAGGWPACRARARYVDNRS